MEKEIKVVPEFNSNMEIVSVTISCDNEGVLGMIDKDTIQGILNKQLGEEYNINVEIKESQFQELQDNGIVKITLQTETVITENNSILLNENDIEDIGSISSEKKTVFRDRSSCSIAKKVNRLAGEILADYLEEDYKIIEAVLRRGMAVYRTEFTFKNGKVYGKSYNAGNIEINLLDKINDSIEIFSTGMDSRNCISLIEQRKGDYIYLQMEIEFNDGNITAKYKLCKRDFILNNLMDISF